MQSDASLLRSDYLICGFCVILSAVTLSINIQYSLWTDELITVWITAGDFVQVYDRATGFQWTSPLYYYLVWIIRRVVGSTEADLRLISLMAFPFTFWSCLSISNYLGGRRAGLIACLTLLSSSAALIAFRNARPYALALMFGFLSTQLFLKWLAKPSLRHITLYVTAALAALLVQIFFVSLLFAHGVIALVFARSKAHWMQFASALVLIGVALAFGIYQIADHYYLKDSMYPFATITFLDSIFILLTPELAVLAFIIAALYLARDKAAWLIYRRPLAIAGILSLAPILLLEASSLLGGPSPLPRYYLSVLPGLVCFVGLALSLVHARMLIAVFSVLPILLALSVARSPFHTEDWRSAVEVASALHAQNRDGVLMLLPGISEMRSETAFKSERYFQYFSSPIEYYPLPDKVALLPYPDSPWFDQATLDLRRRSQITGLTAIIKNELLERSTALDQLNEHLSHWKIRGLKTTCFGSICVMIAAPAAE